MNKLTLILLSAIGGAAAYHFYIRRDERSLSPDMVKPNLSKYTGGVDWSKAKAEASTKLKAEADALTKHITMHKTHINNFLKMHHHLAQAKNVLVRVLSQHTGGLEHEVGGQKVKPEGFVATHKGQVTKLNDRNEFNRLNFLKSQNNKKD